MNAHAAELFEALRNDMQIAISGAQSTIEHTNEDDTRTRARTVLKALQRVKTNMEKVKAMVDGRHEEKSA